jgi:hypothetical protein
MERPKKYTLEATKELEKKCLNLSNGIENNSFYIFLLYM